MSNKEKIVQLYFTLNDEEKLELHDFIANPEAVEKEMKTKQVISDIVDSILPRN